MHAYREASYTPGTIGAAEPAALSIIPNYQQLFSYNVACQSRHLRATLSIVNHALPNVPYNLRSIEILKVYGAVSATQEPLLHSNLFLLPHHK